MFAAFKSAKKSTPYTYKESLKKFTQPGPPLVGVTAQTFLESQKRPPAPKDNKETEISAEKKAVKRRQKTSPETSAKKPRVNHQRKDVF